MGAYITIAFCVFCLVSVAVDDYNLFMFAVAVIAAILWPITIAMLALYAAGAWMNSIGE